MSGSTGPDPELKGLTRFHKLTITCGVLFSFFVAYRFIELWRNGGGMRALWTAVGFAAGGVGLAIYLRGFMRRGI